MKVLSWWHRQEISLLDELSPFPQRRLYVPTSHDILSYWHELPRDYLHWVAQVGFGDLQGVSQKEVVDWFHHSDILLPPLRLSLLQRVSRIHQFCVGKPGHYLRAYIYFIWGDLLVQLVIQTHFFHLRSVLSLAHSPLIDQFQHMTWPTHCAQHSNCGALWEAFVIFSIQNRAILSRLIVWVGGHQIFWPRLLGAKACRGWDGYWIPLEWWLSVLAHITDFCSRLSW